MSFIQVLDEYPHTAEKVCLTPENGERLGHSQFGCCAATGASKRYPEERVIDTGMSVWDDTPNGDIFLSETYVRELGHAIGMVDAEKILEAQAAAVKADERRTEAEEKWGKVTDAYHALVKLIADDPAQATILSKQLAPKIEAALADAIHTPVDETKFATGPKYQKK